MDIASACKMKSSNPPTLVPLHNYVLAAKTSTESGINLTNAIMMAYKCNPAYMENVL